MKLFPVECEELRIDHLTPFLVVTMPYACWFLYESHESHFDGLSNFSPSVDGLVQIYDVDPRIYK